MKVGDFAMQKGGSKILAQVGGKSHTALVAQRKGFSSGDVGGDINF